MTTAQINEKHRRLRGGSDRLKYPAREAACRAMCGRGDNPCASSNHKICKADHNEHQCFLNPGHGTDHEFSSECLSMKPALSTWSKPQTIDVVDSNRE